MIATLRETPGADAVHCGWYYESEEGQRIGEHYCYQGGDLFELFASYCAFVIHSCLVRRGHVLRAGLFDTSLVTSEDMDLWQRVARLGTLFVAVAEPLVIYRLRAKTTWFDFERALRDALAVMTRGHSADPRVADPAPQHAAGASRDDLRWSAYSLGVWAAGVALATGGDSRRTVAIVAEALRGLGLDSELPEIEAEYVAENLFATVPLSLCRPQQAWAQLWPELEAPIAGFLRELQQQTHSEASALLAMRALERRVAMVLPPGSGKIGATRVVDVDVAAPLGAVDPTGGHRVLIRVSYSGQAVGMVELPAGDEPLPPDVVADAIAAELAWPLLGIFFSRTVYPRLSVRRRSNRATIRRGRRLLARDVAMDEHDALHRTVGWTVFLQELWGEPRLSLGRFYRARRYRLERFRRMIDRARTTATVEIAEELPGIAGRNSPLDLEVGLAGIPLTTIRVDSGRRRVDSEKLRGYINSATGMLLCRAAVREAIIGIPLDDPRTLRERLRDQARAGGGQWPRLEATQSLATLVLPRTAAAPLSDHSPYERRKCEQALEVIQGLKRERVLELACGDGHFTQMLAPQVTSLLATDVSPASLSRAQHRCARLSNISYAGLDVFEDPIPGTFDLIVCSEVLYYAEGRRRLARVARKLMRALARGGALVLVHANLIVDEPKRTGYDWDHHFGAAGIGAVFARCSQLSFAHEIRTPLYRIQVFRRERSLPWPLHRRRAARIEEAACETPEPGAAARIRWERRRSDAAYDTARLPILMYHRCAPDGGERLARYRVRPEAFEEQLRYLRDNDYRTTTFAEWRAARAAKRPLRGRRVILTFDDGFADFAEFAWPLLRRYGFGATVFLVAGRIGGTSDWDSAYGDTAALMDWNQILDLQAQGVEFGSHTINHQHLPALSPGEAATELLQARLRLEQRLGRPVRSLAYPFGQYEPWLLHLAGTCGYLDAVTTRSMLSTLEDTDLALPRVEVDGRAGIDDFVRSLQADSAGQVKVS
jgi:peptidoglycan/xylan/chitin deacetylase (PgdA/CDA1 family)/2-polyprenyl-3-methyl-5-hydroxy-6-metoxy-1,4-benzoquinol methylase